MSLSVLTESGLRVSKITALSPARRKPGVAKFKLLFAMKTKTYRKLAIFMQISVKQNQKQSWDLDIR